MNTFTLLAMLLATIVLGCSAASSAGADANPDTKAAKPNIILILADDMGYSDVGCFGGEIQTPHIDRLAHEGTRLTQFYNSARCCPTRASLLTGLHPHQAGIGHMMANKGLPGYEGQLNERCVTLAEALKPAGYRTAMSGKWHISRANVTKARVNHQSREPFWDNKNAWPRQRGFDSYYGTIIGVNDFFDPFSLVRDNEPIWDAPPAGFYYTDAITDEAVKQIRAGGDAPEQPLFLYVAYTAPHWPLHALEEDIRKYEKLYLDGWDQIRHRRREKLIEQKLIDPATPLPPREPDVKPWEEAPNKQWEARRMAVYAAQIDRMDQGIGQILAALDETKQADNTLIIFLSDNGGCAEKVQADWFDIPTKMRDGTPIAVGNNPKIMPGDQSSFQSYGPSWAMASNTPFRRYKHYIHEGGIATPFVMRWPGRVQAGSIDHTVRHLIDIMPTFLEAAGGSYPTDKPPMEGVSLLQPPEERSICWEHEGNRAIRQGDWKLVQEHGQDWELYDLSKGRTETNNLAADHPQRVASMQRAYEEWADRVGVEPWDEIRQRPTVSASPDAAP